MEFTLFNFNKKMVLEVQLSENGGPLEQLKSRKDEWEWIQVLDGNLVQVPVVIHGQRPRLMKKRGGSD